MTDTKHALARLDAAIAASDHWRTKWAELTDAAYALLTDDVELYRNGTPIYGCVCGESVVGKDEAQAHAHVCGVLRREVDGPPYVKAHTINGRGDGPSATAWDVWDLSDGAELTMTEDERMWRDGESVDEDYWYPVVAAWEVSRDA